MRCRPADKNMAFGAMCRTFRHDSAVHHKHMATALHHGLPLKLNSWYIVVYRQWVQFCICLCANVCVSPRASFNPGQPKIQARTGPQGPRVCVHLCKAHTCLLARACVFVCALQHLHPPMQSIISHMSSHETGNDVAGQRRCVSRGSPWTDCCSGTPAFNTPEPIKRRWIIKCTLWKW